MVTFNQTHSDFQHELKHYLEKRHLAVRRALCEHFYYMNQP